MRSSLRGVVASSCPGGQRSAGFYWQVGHSEHRLAQESRRFRLFDFEVTTSMLMILHDTRICDTHHHSRRKEHLGAPRPRLHVGLFSDLSTRAISPQVLVTAELELCVEQL